MLLRYLRRLGRIRAMHVHDHLCEEPSRAVSRRVLGVTRAEHEQGLRYRALDGIAGLSDHFDCPKRTTVDHLDLIVAIHRRVRFRLVRALRMRAFRARDGSEDVRDMVAGFSGKVRLINVRALACIVDERDDLATFVDDALDG